MERITAKIESDSAARSLLLFFAKLLHAKPKHASDVARELKRKSALQAVWWRKASYTAIPEAFIWKLCDLLLAFLFLQYNLRHYAVILLLISDWSREQIRDEAASSFPHRPWCRWSVWTMTQ